MRLFALQTIFISVLYTCTSYIIDNNISPQASNKCIPQNAICDDKSIWSCCEGTTCESIPFARTKTMDNLAGLPRLMNISMCMPNNNNCQKDSDCSGGLGCIVRLGKCGFCKSIGKSCTLPYDKLECCSSYCALRRNEDGRGVCADPTLYSFALGRGTLHPSPSIRPSPAGLRPVETMKSEESLRVSNLRNAVARQDEGWGKEDVHISNLHNVVSNNGETIVIADAATRHRNVNQVIPSNRDRYDIF